MCLPAPNRLRWARFLWCRALLVVRKRPLLPHGCIGLVWGLALPALQGRLSGCPGSRSAGISDHCAGAFSRLGTLSSVLHWLLLLRRRRLLLRLRLVLLLWLGSRLPPSLLLPLLLALPLGELLLLLRMC